MDNVKIYRELNNIIKLGEERIRDFHKARKNVDNFRMAIISLFSNKAHQKCHDELYRAAQEIKKAKAIFDDFEKENKKYFSGAMEKYLKTYKEYLECAKIVSEKRLKIQKSILQIKTGSKSKTAPVDVVNMMTEIDLLVNVCKNKAHEVNETARQITKKG